MGEGIRRGIAIGVLVCGLGSGAALAQAEALKPERFGAVEVVSGGIGNAEQTAMREIKPQYNLYLLFAERLSGEYLATVAVTIADPEGRTVAETVAEGPLLFARLPPGPYLIRVSFEGKVQSRTVTVPASGGIDSAFLW